MPTVKSVMQRRLIVVLALGGLAVLSPVIAARWSYTDTGAKPAVENRPENSVSHQSTPFEYFPAQFQNQAKNAAPEPHIQAF